MEHNFRKKLKAKKKDDDWAPGKSRRAGYYDSNVNERGNKKELGKIKGVFQNLKKDMMNSLKYVYRAVFSSMFLSVVIHYSLGLKTVPQS